MCWSENSFAWWIFILSTANESQLYFSSCDKRSGLWFSMVQHLSYCHATGSAFLVIGLIAMGHLLWNSCSSPPSCCNDIYLCIYCKVTGPALRDTDGLFQYIGILRCNEFTSWISQIQYLQVRKSWIDKVGWCSFVLLSLTFWGQNLHTLL